EVIAPSERIASMINYGIDKLRFLEPVKSNDAVKYRFKLVEITEKAQGKLYKVEARCLLKSNGNPALIGGFLMLAVLKP
ncbi:MAG: MaoC family dehydratase, partial [Pseudomonadota bacterium]|nr:MaoC family dehydratase [Pseudomonadota bacterium]